MTETAQKTRGRITIAEVADLAGVSIATVSRTLNKIGVVREDTQRRVLDAVQQLGYSPNVHASNLATGQSNILGLVVPDITNPMFSELAKAVGEAAHEQNMHVLLTNTYFDPDSAYDSIMDLIESRVAGIVLFTSVLDFGLIDKVAEQRIPICLLDLDITGDYISRIRIDFRNSTVQVLEHLVSLGHRTIAYNVSGGPLKLSPERSNTFLESCKLYEQYLDKYWVVEEEYSLEGGEKVVSALFDGTEAPPTAIWLHGDVTAFGAIRALRDRGLRVPQDVSVVGWGDTLLSRWSQPAITTVSFDHRQLGSLAVEAIRHLSDAKVKTGLKYSLNSHLVVRGSTGTAKG